MTNEHQIEENLIEWLKELKYTYRPDIVDRKALEQNFKTKFEALNRVRLSDSEFLRSRKVSMEEIKKNGYNLNISRYVSTAEDEVQIDLKEVNNK